MVLLAITLL